MKTVTLEEAQAQLSELITRLQAGEKLVIEQNGSPVATLTRSARTSWPSHPGSAKHISHWMAPDFDATPDDFREYMP